MKTMKIIDSLYENNLIEGYFNNWYKSRKEKYEFYDISNDPFELVNLIGDSNYFSNIIELKIQLKNWIDSSDYGNMSEEQMLKEMWLNGKRPKLEEPLVTENDNGIKIISNNKNSSIGWRNNNSEDWKVYFEGEIIEPKNTFEILIFRPGYSPLITTYN